MRKTVFALAGVLLLTVLAVAAQNRQTFTGEIMDSACAAQGGSHATMLKGHGLAGKENDASAKKSCTMECVKSGAELVLYDANTKTSYKLDDAKKAEAYAGQEVKINGTLDAKTNTIHVQSVAKGA
jgi:type 1 fimbria pilin